MFKSKYAMHTLLTCQLQQASVMTCARATVLVVTRPLWALLL